MEAVAFTDALLGAIVVFTATAVGAFTVFFLGKMGKTVYPLLLAFSAGIMSFSAVEMMWAGRQSAGDAAVFGGFLLGVLALFLLERGIPHAHAVTRKGESCVSERKALLVAGAVTLHNIPEGLAVASAFASSLPLGWLVAASIALQDIPEGLLVCLPLACYGLNANRCFWLGILSGIVEALALIIGFMFLSSVAPAIPLGLGFSAGAMAYVILVELLPDAFRGGSEWRAGLSFAAGTALAFCIAKLFSF